MEIDIKYLCHCIEFALSFEKEVKVEYFNGKKPANYNTPQFVTTKMILSGEADKVQMAWYAEIFVDGRCVFRSIYIPSDDNWEVAEKRANEQLLNMYFLKA